MILVQVLTMSGDTSFRLSRPLKQILLQATPFHFKRFQNTFTPGKEKLTNAQGITVRFLDMNYARITELRQNIHWDTTHKTGFLSERPSTQCR